MSDLVIEVRLDGDRLHYSPGDVLAGEFHVDTLSTVEPKAVELSVLWYTEGMGDEDLAVHYFHRLTADDGEHVDFHNPHQFTTQLPASPLSYEGVIAKIRWCVRVRLFPAKGKEVLAELPFQVGDVAPGQEIPKPEELEATETSETESETL